MPPSQRRILRFFSFFFLLVEFVLGQEECKKAILDLFSNTFTRRFNLEHYEFIFPHQREFIFIPAKSLINIVSNDWIVLELIEITTEQPAFASIKFAATVDGTIGTGRIVCTGVECAKLVLMFEMYWDGTTLSCQVNSKGKEFELDEMPDEKEAQKLPPEMIPGQSGACGEIVNSLFAMVSDVMEILEYREDTIRSIDTLEFLFALDPDLIQMFAESKGSQPVMLDAVQFSTEKPCYGSVKFTFENQGKTGTGTFFCTGIMCVRALSMLMEYQPDKGTKELWCLQQQAEKISISATEMFAVLVFVPWTRESFRVIRADEVFKMLIKAQPYYLKSMEAPDAVNKPVHVPLSGPISPVGRDYVGTLINLINVCYKKMSFKVIPRAGRYHVDPEINKELIGVVRRH